jgi:hypothetical protein
VAHTRRRRYRNPRRGGGSSGIAVLLPWVAIGGLLYLMAQNAGKVKAAPSIAATGGCTQPGTGGGTTDFGVTGQCWCG